MSRARKPLAPAGSRTNETKHAQVAPSQLATADETYIEVNGRKVGIVATQIFRSVKTGKEMELHHLGQIESGKRGTKGEQHSIPPDRFFVGYVKAKGRDRLFRAAGVTDDEWSAALALMRAHQRVHKELFVNRDAVEVVLKAWGRSVKQIGSNRA
jgi:hypothetical protein